MGKKRQELNKKEEATGKSYPRCLRCGRKLKNPEYMIRGYGRTCWEKVQDHKETSVLFTLDK